MLRLAFDFIITWRETRTRPNAYLKTLSFMENQKRKSTWSTILKVIIAVATAIGSVIGIQSCI